MYSEFATDPKVQMLSETDQRRFVMILCLRCGNGDVTLQDCEVAFQLRVTVQEYIETKAVLMDRNLIDSDNKPIAWEKRQLRSDTSNERVARFREKQKEANNVVVTLRKRTVEKRERESKHHNSSSDEQFVRFWTAYPKKVGKGAAETAWSKAHINGSITDILAAIEVQKRSDQWRKDGGQFIPNPATWINQRRWEDDLSTGIPAQQDFDPCRGAI